MVAAGVLVFQLGWLIALPAFGGIDEFDHAYRAASVARGHWDPPPVPSNKLGPGDLIPVPRDIVEAAGNRCDILPYTGPQNCHPVPGSARGDEVLVASTAARYNPIYPWLVGTPALPVDGAAALYVMRAMTIILCDVLLLTSWWIVGQAAETVWPRLAALTAITPVLLYATTNAAPNGVQMSAGILMWTSGIALSRVGPSRLLAWSFAGATAALLTVHSTGPLWALGVVAGLVLWPGAARAARAMRRTSRSTCMSAVGVTGLVAAGDLLWSTRHSTNLDWGNHQFPAPDISTLAYALPLWVFQAIGAIPFRDQYVPTVVFAISLTSFGALLWLAFRTASARQRAVMLAISLAFFVVPLVLTLISYHSLGLAWQGRYALPFACGLPLLAGWILDDHPRRSPLTNTLERLLPLGFCLTQAVAIWSVVAQQRERWPEGHGLPAPSGFMLAAIAVAATTLVSVGFADLVATRARPRVIVDDRHDVSASR